MTCPTGVRLIATPICSAAHRLACQSVSHISECNQSVSSSYSVVVISRLVSVIKVNWSAKVSQQRLANIPFHSCILFSF